MDEQNIQTPEVNPEQISPDPEQGLGSNKFFKIWGGVIALIIILSLLGYFAVKNKKFIPQESQNTQSQTENSENSNSGQVLGNFTQVDWLPDLEKQSCAADWCKSCNDGNCYDNYELYKAGTVSSGEYLGKTLYLAVEQGLGASFRHYIIVNDQPVFLDGYDVKNPVKFKNVDDFPDEVVYQLDSKYTLEKGWAGKIFNRNEYGKVLYTDPKLGNVYQANNCLFVERADHIALSYNFKISFLDINSGKVDFTYSNGSKNVDDYDFIQHTCAALCENYQDASKYDEKFNVLRLEIVGQTSTKENIYSYNNSLDPRLQELYNDKQTIAYWSDGAEKSTSSYTYNQFVSMHPYLFWKHPLGFWVEMTNRKFGYLAEMCKPVIYLYPKEQTELTVQVSPNGGFTYTNPAYNGAWKVLANPNGLLKNLADGASYNYLFWEGVGLNYPKTNEGFVVAQKDISGFFDQKLTQLGFNNQERGDFKDYWVDKLSIKPYYQISFLLNSEVDKLAPLTISEKPDTIIRVLIHAKGLNQYKEIDPQILPKQIIRRGFTVVEWGGSVDK